MLKSINPYHGQVTKSVPEHTADQVSDILQKSHLTFQSYRHTEWKQRSAWLHEVADILETKKSRWASLMTEEMGKRSVEAKSEVEKCAWVCRYYADHAQTFLQDEIIESDASRSFVSYQPLGPVLAVMPWNFPFWQVFRFAAPTLMAGNTAILKHASNVPQCAITIEEIFKMSKFPDDVFRTLLIPGKKVEDVIANPIVKAVTLTGSGPAGKAVAAAAGKHLKRSLLELGGSDPYLILEDADLALAVDISTNGRLLNCGQSCIGAKRFIVVGEQFERYITMFRDSMSSQKMGDPSDASIDLGPMASIELRDELHEQVKDSVKAGARVVLGGEIPDQKGAFYPPTVLTDVRPGMRAYHEELFGPVAVVFKVDSLDEAINLANDTPFGLGACVISKDIKKAEEIARDHLEAGACFVNEQVKSDPRLPFGGIKESGYGRELSLHGIREFVNVKTVYLK